MAAQVEVIYIYIYIYIYIEYIGLNIVQALSDFLLGYCADLSTSMKFGTDVDQNIPNSFSEGTEAGAHCT